MDGIITRTHTHTRARIYIYIYIYIYMFVCVCVCDIHICSKYICLNSTASSNPMFLILLFVNIPLYVYIVQNVWRAKRISIQKIDYITFSVYSLSLQIIFDFFFFFCLTFFYKFIFHRLICSFFSKLFNKLS